MSVYTKILLVTALLFSVFLQVTCKQAAERRKKDMVMVESNHVSSTMIHQGFFRDVENFRMQTDFMLAENDSVMNTFKCRLSAENKQGNPYYKNKIATLEDKNREMKKRIDDYKPMDKRQWQTFKEDFGLELANLGQSFRDLSIRNTHPNVECK